MTPPSSTTPPKQPKKKEKEIDSKFFQPLKSVIRYWDFNGREDSTVVTFDDPRNPREDDFARFLERACKQVGTSPLTSHLYAFGLKTQTYHKIAHISKLVKAIKNRTRLYLWDSECGDIPEHNRTRKNVS